MAEHQDTQEKTEEPTAKRRLDAKRKGQVPRSRELNTFLSLLFGAVGLMVLGEALAKNIHNVVYKGLSVGLMRDIVTLDPKVVLAEAIFDGLFSLAPFLLLMLISSFAGPLIMGGWAFSWSAAAFKLDKLNPVTGLKRIFSAKGLMELVKALLKFGVMLVASYLVLMLVFDQMMALAVMRPAQAIIGSTEILLLGLVVLSLAMLSIVSFDVPFQLWEFTRQLKMSRQEVKDELKETDGRPEVKSKIRALQREVSQRRMMEAVPTADVVITNPTHYSVALSYDRMSSDAPCVVAKGKDLVAMKIREIANHHDVAIFSAPPLARALYGHVEIGQQIPEKLFLAVAKVLAYVYHLNEPGGVDFMEKPEDLEIPEEYRGDL